MSRPPLHIWLNGPFGVGKTSVARAIVGLLPGAMLINPEAIGHGLRRHSPETKRVRDFRDLPAWREATARALAAAAAREPGVSLVVPMTVTEPGHLREILQPLRHAGIEFLHVTLTASPETIRRRIRRRLDWPRSKRWALAHLEPSLASLASAEFAPHIDTEGRPVRAVAEEVLALAASR